VADSAHDCRQMNHEIRSRVIEHPLNIQLLGQIIVATPRHKDFDPFVSLQLFGYEIAEKACAAGNSYSLVRKFVSQMELAAAFLLIDWPYLAVTFRLES
jgi:hypothetical protein